MISINELSRMTNKARNSSSSNKGANSVIEQYRTAIVQDESIFTPRDLLHVSIVVFKLFAHSIKLSDEVLAWSSVWSEVQIICVCSS